MKSSLTLPFLGLTACCAALAGCALFGGVSAARGPVPTYAVAVSAATYSDPAWRAVADALVAKYADRRTAVPELVVYTNGSGAVRAALAPRMPRYVAFVMRPAEVRFASVVALHRIMRTLDDDPFDDAVWSIVTGPTPADALRIARARGQKLETALTTTGVDFAALPGRALTLSDGYPAGNIVTKAADGSVTNRILKGDTTHVFGEAWRDLDPDLLVTSSHASQRNLEMPFSRGNIVPRDGKLWEFPGRTLIDYWSGQAKQDESLLAATKVLAAPKNDKIWIAAGNCLIGDNLGRDSMVMAALGYGRANQFMGYIATTWFGEIGWNAYHIFLDQRLTLGESYFLASQNLLRKLSAIAPNQKDFNPAVTDARRYEQLFQQISQFKFQVTSTNFDQKAFAGMLWDRDATVLYGDPLYQAHLMNYVVGFDAPINEPAPGQASRPPVSVSVRWHDGGCEVSVVANRDMPAAKPGDLPIGIVFPSRGPRQVLAANGFGIFLADDFALITSWPALKKGEGRVVVIR